MRFRPDISIDPNLRRYFFYALLIKGLMFAVYAFFLNKNNEAGNLNYIFNYSRDYHSYIDPAVNLVETGVYYENDHGKKLYAHKMPGMTPVFAPMYFLFGLKWSLTILVILQYLVDALCCVLLGCIARKLFNTNKAFYITFFLYAFSSIVSIGSHNAVSELFCTSFSIIAVYYFLKGFSVRNYLLAGLFAAWSVFFRPTAILLLLFLPALALISNGSGWKLKDLKTKAYPLILFFVPFVLFESLWITRNYVTLNRFIPADIVAENFGTPGSKAVFSVIVNLGGDLQSWNDNSEMRWFNNALSENYDSAYANSFPFPEYVLNSGVKKSDLILLRENYFKYDDPSTPLAEKTQLEKEIKVIAAKISDQFKSAAPFHYYVVAPLRTLKTLIFIERPYGFSFRSNDLPEKVLRLWHFICYYVPLILFFMSCLWAFKKRLNVGILLIIGFVVSHTLLYGFIFRYSENRYLVPIHPYLIIIASGTILYILTKYKIKKQQENSPGPVVREDLYTKLFK